MTIDLHDEDQRNAYNHGVVDYVMGRHNAFLLAGTDSLYGVTARQGYLDAELGRPIQTSIVSRLRSERDGYNPEIQACIDRLVPHTKEGDANAEA